MKTKLIVVLLALLFSSFELPDEKIVVYTIGDSTMASKSAGAGRIASMVAVQLS